MGWMGAFTLTCLLYVLCMSKMTSGQTEEQYCLLNIESGCKMGRPPIYMVVAPRRVRAGQVVQVFSTILRMEYGNERRINVRVSITEGTTELASTEVLFDRPSSRLMQLMMPENTPFGNYKLRIEGTLEQSTFGNIFYNETDIEFTTKQASLFIQMSQPIYRQGQKVHFRVIPVMPDLMPKYGSMTIFVEDPNGFPVRRWLLVQTNAGGIVSESFQLADQPKYGTWTLRVHFFGHDYRREFQVEEFWEPRFDVNVTAPAYVIENSTDYISGRVLANHTSGRPCKGNATLTAFFLPREEVWNQTEGWLKDYRQKQRLGSRDDPPEYFPVTSINPKDYHLFFEYDYRFIEYYEGYIDFQWSFDEIRQLGQRAGEHYTIVGSTIMFFANVSDWYTSFNRTGWAATTIYDSRIKLQLIGDSVRSFKPQSILPIHVAVMHYDGTPVVDTKPVMFEVSMAGVGAASVPSPPVSVIPFNGIAEYELIPGPNIDRIRVRASYYNGDPNDRHTMNTYSGGQYGNDRLTIVEMRANRYYSPSKNYVSIRTSTEHPRVNEYMIFHITLSHFMPRVFYQVVAQGNIIIGDELEMTSKQKTFAVALSRDMVPTARIIVYYIQQPEEIVSDVLNFFVNGTRQNQVTLGINRGKDFTRKTIEFNAEADPGSYVAFSGIQYDLYNRGLDDGIAENKLIDELETYDKAARGSYRHLWRMSNTEYEYKFFPGGDYGIDPNTSFNNAGLVMLTDAHLARIPSEEVNLCPEGQFRCMSDTNSESCYEAVHQCNGLFDVCEDGSDEFGCDYHNNTMMPIQPLHYNSRVMRHFENSSWAWQEIFVKPDGRVDFRMGVPPYPLMWMINGLSLSRNIGLGIMQRPVAFDATRYMYIMVEHPNVIVRGEQIGIRVTVFNYWYDDDYMEVLITMHGGDNYEFVIVEDMGFVFSYSPRTHKGDHQTIVFLEPGEVKDIYLPIIPVKEMMRGELNFHVSATSFLTRDEYHGTINVIPDGVMNYYHTPYLVDLIRYASIYVPDFEVPVPEYFVMVGNNRWNYYVPGSGKACVSTFGDVVTPGFFEDYLNAENILWRPYGGGEMITFNFAYNLFTLQFMKTSEQLTNERLFIALDEMNIAFQRMMSYMNPEEGSFKMFRDDDVSSLWLTAFVAKTLHWARFGEWERQLFIPVELLNKITLYICSRQNWTTGAFIPDDHPAYDYKMSSFKQAHEGRKLTDPIPLTAYVLIALYKLEAVSGEAAHCRDNAKQLAMGYLTSEVENIADEDVFQLAIVSYALSHGQTGRIKSTQRLFAQIRNDSDALYFAEQKVWENPSKFLTGIRYLLPRQELMNDAYSVQATAYALLSYIKQEDPDDITKSLMRWLNTMRNTFGGFSSTQDTILAIEALYEFAIQDRNRNIFNLDFNITSSANPGWNPIIDIKKSLYSKLSFDCIPTVWGAITSSVRGTGRALLQLTTTVNVEYDWLIKKPQKVNMADNSENAERIKFFDLDIDDLQWHGRNFSVMEMWPCTRWVYTDRGLTTGLSVLEIDLPTGFIVMNDTLRDYVRSRVVPNLKRAEFYGRKVVFYFTYLDTSKTCVHFRADRWYPTANVTIQYRMRVYDYYEPGMHNTTVYTLFNLFQQNICYSCGSYQCPYCPYFNVAAAIKATVTLFCLIVGFAVKRFLLHS